MQFRLSRLLFFGMIICFLVFTAGIGSADEVNFELVDQIDGYAYDVAIDGDYACVGQGQSLVVIDITDASSPSELGRVITPSTVTGIVVSGKYAYLVVYGGILVTVDISTPSSPKLAGSYDTSDYAYGIAVFGNYAYVATSSGLVIVDVTDPAAPTLAGNYDTDCSVDDIVVSGKHAYLANDKNGLIILDITNPSPTLVGNYDIQGPENIDGQENIAKVVAVEDNYVYLSGYDYSNYTGWLKILNISNPSLPTLVSTYLVNSYTHSEAHPSAITTSDNYVYLGFMTAGGEGCVELVNITNLSAPTFAGGYYTPREVFGLAVSGNYVYIAGLSEGLLILRTDIQNQDNAPELAPIGNKTVNETQLLSFTISATDVDGDAITYSAKGLPNEATFDGNTKTFNWIPGTGTEGVYNVTFTATANGLNDSETITITVSDWNPWNDPVSQDGEKISLSELQTAIYDWRFGVTLPTRELVDLTRLQGLIYSWRFG